MAASRRRLRRISCEGKRPYATQTDAVAAMIAFLKRNPDHQLATYHCRLGNHWHFGHQPVPRRQTKIHQQH